MFRTPVRSHSPEMARLGPRSTWVPPRGPEQPSPQTLFSLSLTVAVPPGLFPIGQCSACLVLRAHPSLDPDGPRVLPLDSVPWS